MTLTDGRKKRLRLHPTAVIPGRSLRMSGADVDEHSPAGPLVQQVVTLRVHRPGMLRLSASSPLSVVDVANRIGVLRRGSKQLRGDARISSHTAAVADAFTLRLPAKGLVESFQVLGMEPEQPAAPIVLLATLLDNCERFIGEPFCVHFSSTRLQNGRAPPPRFPQGQSVFLHAEYDNEEAQSANEATVAVALRATIDPQAEAEFLRRQRTAGRRQISSKSHNRESERLAVRAEVERNVDLLAYAAQPGQLSRADIEGDETKNCAPDNRKRLRAEVEGNWYAEKLRLCSLPSAIVENSISLASADGPPMLVYAAQQGGPDES